MHIKSCCLIGNCQFGQKTLLFYSFLSCNMFSFSFMFSFLFFFFFFQYVLFSWDFEFWNYDLNKLWFNSWIRGRISIWDRKLAGAPESRGQRGQLPPLPKQCGDSTGATGCPFYRNCTSKFVRYSQELEFITIFKQCLSNLCLIFNQYWKSAFRRFYLLVCTGNFDNFYYDKYTCSKARML